MFGRKKSSQPPTPATSTNEAADAMEEGRRGKKTKISSKRMTTKKKKLELIPARRTPHKLFILFSIVTALCAVWMAAGQIMGIIIYENSVVTYVLRGYVVLLCLLVVLIELEWPRTIRETTLFQFWVTRGLLYTFIGVVGMQENESSDVVLKKDSEAYEMLDDIVMVVAWNMVGCGLLYFFMGLFCLKFLLNRYRADYAERMERAREENQADDGDGESDDGDNDSSDLTHKQEAVEVATAVFADDTTSTKPEWTKEDTTKVQPPKNDSVEETEEAKGSESKSDSKQPAWVNEEEGENKDKKDNNSVGSQHKQPSWVDGDEGESSVKEGLSAQSVDTKDSKSEKPQAEDPASDKDPSKNSGKDGAKTDSNDDAKSTKSNSSEGKQTASSESSDTTQKEKDQAETETGDKK